MHEGLVEATRYPRNPLDVLAQQIVAMCTQDTWSVDELYATCRRAYNFDTLPRSLFDTTVRISPRWRCQFAGRRLSDP